MLVAIAGAHGQIGMRLAELLADRGDTVTGLIRNPDHASELEAIGVGPVVCDLETAPMREIADAVAGAEAVVFAAGAGPGSGAARKLTMDRDGAIKLLHASDESHARYLIISSVGAESPPSDDEVFSVYLRAKAEADAAVIASDRDYAVIRPGPLGNEPGTGRVRLSTEPFRGAVPRDDVASVLAAILARSEPTRAVLYLSSGETAVEAALATALGSD